MTKHIRERDLCDFAAANDVGIIVDDDFDRPVMDTAGWGGEPYLTENEIRDETARRQRLWIEDRAKKRPGWSAGSFGYNNKPGRAEATRSTWDALAAVERREAARCRRAAKLKIAAYVENPQPKRPLSNRHYRSDFVPT